MREAAAIRRASRQARVAMQALDQASAEELLQIHQDAAAEVRARIAAAADAGGLVQVAQLRNLLRQIEDVIDTLAQRRDELLASRLDDAARLGARPFTLQGVAAVGGGTAPLDSAMADQIATSAVNFVRSLREADGLVLSDRLWRLNRGAREAVTRVVEQAVVQGTSATQAAQQFILRGEQVPGDIAARVMRGRASELAQAAGDLLGDRNRGAFAQAERVMRTEINRAHGEAYMAAAVQTPGFAGFRYLLSPAHPAPDICDLLSTQNLHGLGPGVYPSREETPWPAHPNTLSFLVMVFADEITDQDRAGKETPLQALGRLTAEQRDGVLGKTKASYFDQGLLRTGMIRSPLRAVRGRVE
ncbi:hypothetical protein DFR41_104218 [Pseudacidovorax intermedius]|uniref:Uncharacterized protein n=1 Tax=Pseudacidovorax intermedius TaxID=433924 RepID=A0A370FFG9_9BURK|nr:hypothetical protein [Pseudacidovorax intermedius]RDI25162.1 hypothetical protein DFR41_104218 [Pseudacidovorax intermedius]